MKLSWTIIGVLAILTLSIRPCTAAETKPDDLVATAKRIAADGTGRAIRGKQGWLFLRSELRHIGTGVFWGEAAASVSLASSPALADPMEAILDYNRQCKALGIELILMPVPPKAVIYPDALADLPAKRQDPNHQAFYAALRAQGVTVLDITDRLLEKRDSPVPLFCKQDTHWAGPAMEIAAVAVAGALREREWFKALPKTAFSAKPFVLEMQGDLRQAAAPPELPAEPVTLRQICDPKGETVRTDSASPIVLMGDSHCLVFHEGGDMHAVGAGLADQLAMELGIPVDVMGVKGSGARPARINVMRRAVDASWLAGKKVIIWCFTAREFTEADGWGKVPLKK